MAKFKRPKHLGSLHERMEYVIDLFHPIRMNPKFREFEGAHELETGIYDLRTMVTLIPNVEFAKGGRKLQKAKAKKQEPES